MIRITNRGNSLSSCGGLLIALTLFITLVVSTLATQLPGRTPAAIDVSVQRLAQMDSIIQAEIAQKHLPGAVVLVSRRGQVVWRKAYGARAVEPAREAMSTDTIFDLASLTKVVATATSIMILVERGKVRLG